MPSTLGYLPQIHDLHWITHAGQTGSGLCHTTLAERNKGAASSQPPKSSQSANTAEIPQCPGYRHIHIVARCLGRTSLEQKIKMIVKVRFSLQLASLAVYWQFGKISLVKQIQIDKQLLNDWARSEKDGQKSKNEHVVDAKFRCGLCNFDNMRWVRWIAMSAP